MSVAFAPGKVILVGEHAVVHGRPAIALAAKDGATAIVRPAPAGRSTIRVFDRSGSSLSRLERFERALAATLATAERTEPVEVELRLSIPPGGGLGSSAAMGVALVRALDPSAKPEVVFRRAMAWERVFHGSPSGVDVAASLFGGCIRFQRTEYTRRVELGKRLRVCVGHSGTASDTAAVVARIDGRRRANATKVDVAFDRLGDLADAVEGAIGRADVYALGGALDEAQSILAQLELSTPAIDAMCTLALGVGALGAKLTGAGAGGAVIAVAEDAVVPRVISSWRRAGFAASVIETPPAAAPCLSSGVTNFERTIHE